MAHILKEEKYPSGSLKSRETELHGRLGKRMILKESWYPPQVDPLNPWQATDVAQQRSGQQMYKGNYVNGQKHGVQERWYDNSRQEYKENYVNGQLHGVQERWWYHNGRQANKENYVNGKKYGLQEDWYENGRQAYKWNYVNGQQHGVQEARFDNGQQQFKLNFVNGKEHGVQEYWYEDGQQDYKKYYLDGVEKSQQAYQSYVEGLTPEIQATTDFGERGLSGIIASYLLP
jgi:antitoxin component YwqK of YwqJK toxin-antitoxin module